ncbi:MAG: pyrroline-5-carboxylate reductase [Chloroflexi bacterium]|nr:pyrroline-5-carboxylate reductase [Chloroflexota bacterium]
MTASKGGTAEAIAFVGGGVMAEAIIRGILAKGVAQKEDVTVGEPAEARRRHLTERYGVATMEENLRACQGAGLVLLAVKPQSLREIFQELQGRLKPSQSVLSIVAGARVKSLAQGLAHPNVIRAMPNTPAQIGAGVSVWTAASEVPKEAVQRARSILRALGEEVYVSDEKLIDMATALSASGPAYVFYFIESLIDAGVYLGMPRDMARTLAVETVLGSAHLVKASGSHPGQLRDKVTSPGGTTIEGLLQLEEGGFKAAVMKAVIAAYKKSLALGEG